MSVPIYKTNENRETTVIDSFSKILMTYGCSKLVLYLSSAFLLFSYKADESSHIVFYNLWFESLLIIINVIYAKNVYKKTEEEQKRYLLTSLSIFGLVVILLPLLSFITRILLILIPMRDGTSFLDLQLYTSEGMENISSVLLVLVIFIGISLLRKQFRMWITTVICGFVLFLYLVLLNTNQIWYLSFENNISIPYETIYIQWITSVGYIFLALFSRKKKRSNR